MRRRTAIAAGVVTVVLGAGVAFAVFSDAEAPAPPSEPLVVPEPTQAEPEPAPTPNLPPDAQLWICSDTTCIGNGGTLTVSSTSGDISFDALANNGDPKTPPTPSSDPDGDPLGFEWLIGGELVTPFPDFTFDPAALDPGPNSILLRVGDDKAAVTEVRATVIVETSASVQPEMLYAEVFGGNQLIRLGIWSISSEGQLTRITDDNDALPKWSSDHSMIALVRSVDFSDDPDAGIDYLPSVVVIDREGKVVIKADTALAAAGQFPGSFGYSWGPDNLLVVDGGLSANGSDRGIWGIDVTTGRATEIVNDPQAHESYPKVSPDGQWVSYVAFDETTSIQTTRVVELATGELRGSVTDRFLYVWDSSSCCLIGSMVTENGTEIVSVDLDSGATTILHTEAPEWFISDIAASTTGPNIAYVRNLSGGFFANDLIILNIDNSEAELVGEDWNWITDLDWSSSGNVLAFRHTDEGMSSFILMVVPGNDPSQIAVGSIEPDW